MAYINKGERECLQKNLNEMLDTQQRKAWFLAACPIANKRLRKIMRNGSCTYQDVETISKVFGIEARLLISGLLKKRKEEECEENHDTGENVTDCEVVQSTENLKKNITALIMNSGLTQKAFAQKVGISDSVVSQMRAGKQKTFRWSSIEAVARTCGITADELLRGDVGAADRKEADTRKAEDPAPVSNLAFYRDMIIERANEIMESTGHPAETSWCAALHSVIKDFGENISSPEDTIRWLEGEHHEEVIDATDTERDLIERYRSIDPGMEFGKTPLEALRAVGMFGEIKSDMTIGYIADHLS